MKEDRFVRLAPEYKTHSPVIGLSIGEEYKPLWTRKTGAGDVLVGIKNNDGDTVEVNAKYFICPMCPEPV